MVPKNLAKSGFRRRKDSGEVPVAAGMGQRSETALSAPAPLCIPRGEWPEAAGIFRARPWLASIAPLVQSGFETKTLTRATPMLKLSDAALAHLPPGMEAPGYDRAGLKAGIVHIGLGNFHRAHQAVYLDDLLRQGLARDWAILGAGVQPAD